MVFNMLFVVLWVSDGMERAADDGLRFGLFGNDDPLESVFACSDPAEFSDEVGIASALHEQLGCDRVVVIVDRDMAIGAGLGFRDTWQSMWSGFAPIGSAPNGVRNVGAERDAAKSLATDGLLLSVNRFAVGVVAANVDRARASSGADAIASDVAIAGQHVHVVAERLEIVGDTISRDFSKSMQIWSLDVGFLGQMATKTTWVPRAMACDAAHVAVLVSAFFVGESVAPTHHPVAVHPNRLCHVAFWIVLVIARIDGVGGLGHFPRKIFFDVAALN